MLTIYNIKTKHMNIKYFLLLDKKILEISPSINESK